MEKSTFDCSWIQIFWNVTVWSKGQIVIPNEVRKIMDIKPGDSLISITKHAKVMGFIKSDQLEEFVALMQEELEILKKRFK